MADILDTIDKLIALALNNPNEEEARSAAFRAVQLIRENKVTIGGPGRVVEIKQTTMTPEEQAEFLKTMEEVLKAQSKNALDPDAYMPTYRHPDPDLDDGFMKKRVIEAWRQIRVARKMLEGEIDRYERETRRKYPR